MLFVTALSLIADHARKKGNFKKTLTIFKYNILKHFVSLVKLGNI